MHLSDNTIQVLKNFSSISPSLLVKEGNVLRTMNRGESVLAEATLDESFPQEFGIYDLKRLIAILSIHDKPEIKFEESELVLSGQQGRAITHLRYCDLDLIPKPRGKRIAMKDDVTFTLSQDQLDWIEKVAATLKCSHVVVQSKDGNIVVTTTDMKKKIDSSDFVVGSVQDNISFKFVLVIENLKLMPGNYEVAVDANGISRWTNKDQKIIYWIAVEKKESEFNRG